MKEQTTSVKTQNLMTRQLTLIGLMTAVTCILGPLSVPLPFTPVPITLTNFAICLSVYVLGTRNAVISCAIYLLLGTVGLPVFSSFSGGLGKLAGPTGGYLIGFLFLALIQGVITDLFQEKNAASVAGMILGTAVCYTFGTIWLARQMNLTFLAALSAGVIPYLPGDAAKTILAALIGPRLRASLRKAGMNG